jgi:cytochrome d ubiquinol oxidase subunit I
VLGGVFVIGVSCWLLLKRRNREFALRSIKVGGCVGLIGILLTMWTGDGSAVEVARTQPMKLAAMEGLYDGQCGQSIVALGIINPDKRPCDNQEAMTFDISIPYGLSILAKHDANAFVPGINDIIAGVELTETGDTINTVSYAERIALGKQSQQALRDYQKAKAAGDTAAMADYRAKIADTFKYFGYGYLQSPEEAVPPVALTFYAFHLMVVAGGYLLLFFVVVAFASWKKKVNLLTNKWFCIIGLLTIPVVWICSEAGWVVAEVGRQPWTIDGLLPVNVGVSSISASSVETTFWMFVVVFTGLIAAEISIMVREIKRKSKIEILDEVEK